MCIPTPSFVGAWTIYVGANVMRAAGRFDPATNPAADDSAGYTDEIAVDTATSNSTPSFFMKACLCGVGRPLFAG